MGGFHFKFSQMITNYCCKNLFKEEKEMITFILGVALLLAGYFIYGRYVERTFNPDPMRPTPAETLRDGIDYIPMPKWKNAI